MVSGYWVRRLLALVAGVIAGGILGAVFYVALVPQVTATVIVQIGKVPTFGDGQMLVEDQGATLSRMNSAEFFQQIDLRLANDPSVSIKAADWHLRFRQLPSNANDLIEIRVSAGSDEAATKVAQEAAVELVRQQGAKAEPLLAGLRRRAQQVEADVVAAGALVDDISGRLKGAESDSAEEVMLLAAQAIGRQALTQTQKDSERMRLLLLKGLYETRAISGPIVHHPLAYSAMRMGILGGVGGLSVVLIGMFMMRPRRRST